MSVKQDKETGIWRYRVMVQLPDGTKQRISGSCMKELNTKTQAKILEHQHIERTLNPGKADALAEVKPVPTFAEFSATYMALMAVKNKVGTVTNKQNILDANLLPYFGAKKLDDISLTDVEDYAAEKSLSFEKSSIGGHIVLLTSILNKAKEREIIAKVPKIAKIKGENTAIEFISKPDLKRLLDMAGELYLLILVAVNTGMRIGELIALKWSDINFAARQIVVSSNCYKGHFGSPKGGKARTIPMNAKLWTALKAEQNKATCEYVFARNGSYTPYHIIEKRLGKLAKKSKIKANAHLFRHTYISYLVMAGVHIKSVQAYAGHADLKETMRYIHLAPNADTEAMSKLDAFWTKEDSGEQKRRIALVP